MERLLKRALKQRQKLIRQGKSKTDVPLKQFMTNMNDWLSKPNPDIESIIKNHENMIRFMLPPSWIVRFENELKLLRNDI